MNELDKISNEALIKELNKRIREGKMKSGEKEQKTLKPERSDYHQLKTIDEWKKYDIPEPLLLWIPARNIFI